MSDDGEWHIDGSVVVSRYTQTRQRWLRTKIIKSDHDRHYKKAFAMHRREDNKHHGIRNLKTRK